MVVRLLSLCFVALFAAFGSRMTANTWLQGAIGAPRSMILRQALKLGEFRFWFHQVLCSGLDKWKGVYVLARRNIMVVVGTGMQLIFLPARLQLSERGVDAKFATCVEILWAASGRLPWVLRSAGGRPRCDVCSLLASR